MEIRTSIKSISDSHNSNGDCELVFTTTNNLITVKIDDRYMYFDAKSFLKMMKVIGIVLEDKLDD